MNKIKYGTEFLDQLKDSVHDLYDENKELKEEIERLNKENTILTQNSQYLVKQKDELEEELERLNNIIEEIEDSIVGKINVLYQVRNQANAIQELNILLRQLRELKGVDKE